MGENLFALLAILLFIGVMIMPIVFIIRLRTSRLWKAGFNPTSTFSQDNLMDAYICLSANMILKDRVDTGKKIMYMKNFFHQKFPESMYNFSDALTYAYKNPTDIKIISAWMNRYLPKKEDRIQVLYFLTGISMVDGLLIDHEKNLLNNLRFLLQLDQADLDSIIGMYTSYKEEKTKTNSSSKSNPSKLHIYKQILGVYSEATFDEIKKSYRKLAMINHPDKFESAGQAQMNLAKERFLKIQEAYDYLEGMMKG